jgi:hypothetical protein
VTHTRIFTATAATLLLAAACSDGRGPTEPTKLATKPLFQNTPIPKAAFTTINEAADAVNGVTKSDLCKNGNPEVNCNQYGSKEYVWMNGGPVAAALTPGTYFFAVLQPGGQGNNEANNPNDGTGKNLSDKSPAPWADGINSDGSARPSGDSYLNRVFTVNEDGSISYSGNAAGGETPHSFAGSKIRLFPYDDTPNPGGVYIMAICSLADVVPAQGTPGVNPSDCKYDAFKVNDGTTTGGEAAILDIEKGVTATYDADYTYLLEKSVSPTGTQTAAVGTSVAFDYTVQVTRTGPIYSGWELGGSITVKNPNSAAVIIDGITDELQNAPAGSSCTVSGLTTAGERTIPGGSVADPGSKTYNYTCALDAAPVAPATSITNKATVAWSRQLLDNGDLLAAGNNVFETGTITFAADQVTNASATITDVYNGTGSTLGTMTLADASPKTYTYSKSIPVSANVCTTRNNTATATPSNGGLPSSDNESATVCPPNTSGGLTMGYWQNNNGQRQIATASCTALRTYLRTYLPFQDLSATATCGSAQAVNTAYKSVQIGSITEYVSSVIFFANAKGASLNAMLKGQMLATALSAHFDPTLASAKIDLTKVCSLASNCTGANIANYSVFWGASSQTVSWLLDQAAAKSNAGGVTWYSQVKTDQEKAKNTFDAINNNKTYVLP